MGLGGVIGAGSGAILGSVIDPNANGKTRTRHVILGSVIGGMAGMLAGNAVHSKIDDEKQTAFALGKKSGSPRNSQSSAPGLSGPRVETIWVEGKVMGNRYVEPHYEHIITEQARWEVEE